MYGTQTSYEGIRKRLRFENDVNMYGTQTFLLEMILKFMFENDVNMYGTQTQSTRASTL